MRNKNADVIEYIKMVCIYLCIYIVIYIQLHIASVNMDLDFLEARKEEEKKEEKNIYKKVNELDTI